MEPHIPLKGNLLVALNAKYGHTNLAVRYLQDALEQAGVAVSLLERTINEPDRDILGDIVSARPAWVMFSCYIWNWSMVCRIGEMLRRLLPECRILLGGPEVSSRDFHPPIWSTAVVQGEGERLLPQVLLQPGETPPGTILREDAFVDLDTLSFPYKDLDALNNRTLYYESSRGCPFRCAYCLSGQEKDKPRYRRLELVYRDLQRFLDAGVRRVKFVDRTFNSHPQRTEAIWRYLLEKDNGMINVQFEVAGDLLTEGQLALLMQSRPGLFQLEIGVQSVCESTLRQICRKTDMARLAENVRCVMAGKNVHCHLDLIAGLPGETMAQTVHGCNLLLGWGVHQLQLGFLKVLAGSPLGEIARESGLVYNPHPPYDVLETPSITFGELRRLEGLSKGIECFWNSGRFHESIRYLLGRKNLGQGLLALWEWLPKRPVGKYDYYDYLYGFAQKKLGLDASSLEHLRYLLRWDLCRHERPKKLPQCLPLGKAAKRIDLPADLSREIYGEWWPTQYVPQQVQQKNAWTLCLFDYRHRDIFGRAAVLMPGQDA